MNSNIGNSFTDFSTTLFQSMQSSTSPYYNVDELRDIFPQFREDLEMFEVLSYDTDGTLYDALSTPDTKLYYPEPFIASPFCPRGFMILKYTSVPTLVMIFLHIANYVLFYNLY
jgi:hypothetical protein